MGERDALEVLYEGWEAYQRGLAEAISDLTDEQLSFRVAPNLRSVGRQLQHMIGVRAGWLHGDLGEGPREYDAISQWTEDGAPQRTADELRQGLEVTWVLLRECLDRWTPEDLTETVHSQWPGQEDETFVRGWVVWHLIEHDLHHGGELGFALGAQGLPAPKI